MAEKQICAERPDGHLFKLIEPREIKCQSRSRCEGAPSLCVCDRECVRERIPTPKHFFKPQI